MPAIGAALASLLGALVHALALRGSGGWIQIYRARRGLPTSQHRACKSWAELTTVERGWYFGVPIFMLAGALLMAIGIASMVAG